MIKTIENEHGLTLILSPCNRWDDHLDLGTDEDIQFFIEKDRVRDIEVVKELVLRIQDRLGVDDSLLGMDPVVDSMEDDLVWWW